MRALSRAVLAGGRPLWTPAKLGAANLLGWYDPSDPAAVTTAGGKVTALADKSGNGAGLTSGGSGAAAATVGARSGLALTGAADTSFGIVAPNAVYTTNYSFAAVVGGAPSQNGNYPRVHSIGNSAEYGADYNIAGYLDVSRGSDGSTMRAETNGSYVSGGALTAGPQVIDAVFSSSNTLTTDLNGAQAGFTSINYNFYVYSKYFYLYGGQPGYGGVVGVGGEAIIGNTAWTGDTLARVQGYLAWRWGLQASLPSGHPYAKAPPYA